MSGHTRGETDKGSVQLFLKVNAGRPVDSSKLFLEWIDDIIKYDMLKQFHKFNGQTFTLLHVLATQEGFMPMIKIVLSKISFDYAKELIYTKNNKNKTVLDLATTQHKEYFSFFLRKQSSDSIEQMKTVSNDVFKQNLIIDTIYKKFLSTKGISFLMDLLDIYIELLNNHLPFSDDLLLVCMKFIRDNKTNTDANGIYIKNDIISKKKLFCDTFINAIKVCLNTNEKLNELTEFHKWYFKEFLVSSNYWYLSQNGKNGFETFGDVDGADSKTDEIDSDELVTFDELTNYINKEELSKQKEFLIESINNLKTEEQNDWLQLTSYEINPNLTKYPNLLGKGEKPRQDEIKNGIKATYDTNMFDSTQLFTKNEVTKTYNFKHLYSTNIYLEKLLIVGHRVNDQFQSEMSKVFENKGFNYQFTEAPVKLRKRCVVKCESDYSTEMFPNAACLLDIVRCGFTFDTINDLLQAMKVFENKYGDSIIRIKNGFFKFDDYNEFEYKDIKYNIIVTNKDTNESIIAEVQFILKCMDDAKKMGHFYYSIVRQSEFIHNVKNLYNGTYVTKNNSYTFDLLRNPINKRDYVSFGLTLALTYVNQDMTDLIFNFKQESILHVLFRNYWLKGYKLFEAFYSKYCYDVDFVSNKNSSIASAASKEEYRDSQFSKMFGQWYDNNELSLMKIGWKQWEGDYTKLNELSSLFKKVIYKYHKIIELNKANQYAADIIWMFSSRLNVKCLKILFDLCLKYDFKNQYDLDKNNTCMRFIDYTIQQKETDKVEVIGVFLDPKYKKLNEKWKIKLKNNSKVWDNMKKFESDGYKQLFDKFINQKKN